MKQRRIVKSDHPDGEAEWVTSAPQGSTCERRVGVKAGHELVCGRTADVTLHWNDDPDPLTLNMCFEHYEQSAKESHIKLGPNE